MESSVRDILINVRGAVIETNVCSLYSNTCRLKSRFVWMSVDSGRVSIDGIVDDAVSEILRLTANVNAPGRIIR